VAGDQAEIDADRLASRLGAEAIAAAERHAVVAWVPDPQAPGRRAQLEVALEGMPAALGPAVALGRAPLSLARARRARAGRRAPADPAPARR